MAIELKSSNNYGNNFGNYQNHYQSQDMSQKLISTAKHNKNFDDQH
jgi:hypothetical protein